MKGIMDRYHVESATVHGKLPSKGGGRKKTDGPVKGANEGSWVAGWFASMLAHITTDILVEKDIDLGNTVSV